MSQKYAYALLLPALLLAACGGGSGTTDDPVDVNPPAPVFRPLQPAEIALAERLALVQMDDGSYGWAVGANESVDTSGTGYQNVTGITALGLLDAHAADLGFDSESQDTYFAPAALDAARDYLVGVMTAYVNNDPAVTHVSPANFIFLRAYKDLLGMDDAEWQIVEAAFAMRLQTWDDTYGTDATVLIDGAYHHLESKRASIPSLIGWDAAFLVKALKAMDYPQAEIDWMVSALEMRAYDPAETYGVLSMAHVLEVLAGEGSDLVPDLHQRLLAEGSADGSFQDDEQVSAYALMALRAVQDPAAGDTAAWLMGRVLPTGQVVLPDDNEYFEIDGEVLTALLR